MAEAKKSTTTASVLDPIKASLGMTLLALTGATFILILIFGLLFDAGSDKILTFLALAGFAALVGLFVRLLADGSTAFWLAAVFGGVGTTILHVYGSATGIESGPEFGHIFLEYAMPEGILTVGAVLGALVALIVAKWSSK